MSDKDSTQGQLDLLLDRYANGKATAEEVVAVLPPALDDPSNEDVRDDPSWEPILEAYENDRLTPEQFWPLVYAREGQFPNTLRGRLHAYIAGTGSAQSVIDALPPGPTAGQVEKWNAEYQLPDDTLFDPGEFPRDGSFEVIEQARLQGRLTQEQMEELSDLYEKKLDADAASPDAG